MYQNNTTGLLVVGLLVGAAIGVAAGLMLAPQAGNKTREILRQGIVTGAGRIRELRRSFETETPEAEAPEAEAQESKTGDTRAD